MPGLTYVVEGGPELAAALRGVAAGLDDLPGDGPVRLLVADARRRAPRKTGRLAASISGRPGASQAEVGTSVKYGRPVHQGVPSHNLEPHRFLTDALDAQTAQIVGEWTKDVQSLIDRKV